jgi:hypothetical protein
MAAMYGPHEHRFAGMSWFGADGMKVSWGGVFAGVLVALGIVLLMSAIGAALGVGPTGGADGPRGAGAGLWAELQRFVALFVGGLVATRTSAIVDRATLVCVGILVWVVTFGVMAHIGGGGASALTRSAFSVLDVAPTTFTPGGTPGDASSAAADAAVNGGSGANAARLRSPELAEEVASVTGLSVADARTMLAQAAERIDASRPTPQDVEDTARPRTQALDRALAAQDQGVTREPPRLQAWLALASLSLSLAAAVAGALLGRSRGVVTGGV